MKRFQLLLFTILSYALVSSTVSAYTDPIGYDQPMDISANISGTDTQGSFLYNEESWYVVGSATSSDYNQLKYVWKYDYDFSLDTDASFNASVGTSAQASGCGLSGYETDYYYECDDFQMMNSTHAEYICMKMTNSSVGGANHQVMYYNLDVGTLTDKEYALDSDAGDCARMTARLSNRGSGVTGYEDVHIAFIDASSTMSRIRELTGTPQYDTYPMPSITALYDYVPIQTVLSANECFHDSGNDCGSYLLYTATTPSDSNRRLYVNEYSEGVCGITPSNFCYFSGEANLYHNKKLLTDQQVFDMDVTIHGQGTSTHYEVIYKSIDDGYYWTAIFDDEWNLVTRWRSEQSYGNPYATNINITSVPCDFDASPPNDACSYNYTYDLSNFTVGQYDTLYLNYRCDYSNSGTGGQFDWQFFEKGNMSNYYTGSSGVGSHNTGWNDDWRTIDLPESLEDKTLDASFIAWGVSPESIVECNPQLTWFIAGEYHDPRMEIGIEDRRFTVWSGKKGDQDTVDHVYLSAEPEQCICGNYTVGSCVGEYRQYTRVCFPSGCDDQVAYQYDASCEAGGCTPQYVCYNSTHLCLYQSDCTFDTDDCSECPYYCNEYTDACYDSPICPSCPTDEYVQSAFPDCTCSCTNWCSLGYENISVSCACKDTTIDTESWRDNPVAMFQDMSAGVINLMSPLTVPLILLMLSIAFAGIITYIMKSGSNL